MVGTSIDHWLSGRRLGLILACSVAVAIAPGRGAVAHPGAEGHVHVAQGPASGPAWPHLEKDFQAKVSAFHGLKHAVARLQPTEGQTAQGTVHFTVMGDHVHVVADLTGLAPNSTHGFHIHEFGDCSAPDGKSAGGHYNPQGHTHALPDQAARHAGDLGNLTADAAGTAHYSGMIKNISIAGMQNPIVGRGVIVHAKPDDGGQPTGNAGPRIACGVIGVGKPSR